MTTDQRLLMPSRGCVARNYFLMTPENFVSNALPHFRRTVVVLLATPRDTDAKFAQYLLRLEPSGGSERPRVPVSRTSSSSSRGRLSSRAQRVAARSDPVTTVICRRVTSSLSRPPMLVRLRRFGPSDATRQSMALLRQQPSSGTNRTPPT